MEKSLRPERFKADPTALDAVKRWKHWYRTFSSYIVSLTGVSEANKLNALNNHVDFTVYEYISECATYEDAIACLERIYVKPVNLVFARHLLSTSKQQVGESLEDFFQKLKKLSLDCNFKDVTAAVYREETIRNAFIAGINSNYIRQRLLEGEDLSLQNVFDKARSLDEAQRNANLYNNNNLPDMCNSSVATCSLDLDSKEKTELQTDSQSCLALKSNNCMFCGNRRHARKNCPAKDVICFKCSKKGHFSKVCLCKNMKSGVVSAACEGPILLTVESTMKATNEKVNIKIKVNESFGKALLDTGSTYNHISTAFAKQLKLPIVINQQDNQINLAIKGQLAKCEGSCSASVVVLGRYYSGVNFTVMDNLLTDIILGQEFMQKHESVDFKFGGDMPSLQIAALKSLKTVSPPRLFEHMSNDCQPIATKSRRYSQSDKVFIRQEIAKLLKDGIIEPSSSPWRAQVVVTKNDNHKKRLCVDYSQTINKFTHLDAYPLPRMQEVIKNVSQYSVYSTLDLRSAYHQVELLPEEKIYTAFEADGGLYQAKRLFFGLKNAVPCFQRIVDDLIKNNHCEATFAYLDNITICGNSKSEHDANLKHFLKVAKDNNLTFNEDKCSFSANSIDLLGYRISKEVIKPDPDRIKPLLELPVPHNMKSLRRIIGMFAYYAQWIPKHADLIKPLVATKTFPLSSEAQLALKTLKDILSEVTLKVIDENAEFTVETDASDIAISASLNQNNRPVAFFSRTLNKSETKHSSIEKEAMAIVESIRKWAHFLAGRHFKLITDQRSVAFMYDLKKHSKIKNNKILRWRMELSEFEYDIVYRPGKYNIAADTFSRAYCASMNENTLYKIHESLCHPGITRFNHFIKTKNLPYSIDEVRKVVQECRICSEIKPTFYRPPVTSLIKATQPLERLNLDFKGPIPSTTKNHYILTIIDEFTRFPFAFPCSNIDSKSVIKCLNQLFTIFGMPSYIHSDRGKAFLSNELITFLHSRGIATSKTSSYNPRGNSQCERFNGIIWTGVKLALKSRGLNISQWELVLPDVLHSIRSLLSTATNVTPHERLFNYQRRSSSGISVPSWLSSPGSVLLRRRVRASKYEPLVDEVELVHATPNYAYVRLPSGNETTVSLRDLAPVNNIDSRLSNGIDSYVNEPSVSPDTNIVNETVENNQTEVNSNEVSSENSYQNTDTPPNTSQNHTVNDIDSNSDEINVKTPELRKSSRETKPVYKYGGVTYW